jgi:hypothetical protein
MKKNIFRVLAVILPLGLMLLTSCNKEYPDNSIFGDWLVKIDRGKYGADGEVEYILFTFQENGVVVRNNYVGAEDNWSLDHWERMRRHGIYALNESAKTFDYEDFGDESGTAKYSFSNGLMSLTVYYDDTSITETFHRPSWAELQQLARYDKTIEGDDYVGKWFGVSEFNGLYTYVMNDFSDDGELTTIRYSVYGNECTRTESTRACYEGDAFNGKRTLEIYDEADYSVSRLWWTVKDNVLTIGLIDPESTSSDFHPITKADKAKMAELDKMVK